jgi:hypothetical protein
MGAFLRTDSIKLRMFAANKPAAAPQIRTQTKRNVQLFVFIQHCLVLDSFTWRNEHVFAREFFSGPGITQSNKSATWQAFLCEFLRQV